jgi:hypothetical protein
MTSNVFGVFLTYLLPYSDTYLLPKNHMWMLPKEPFTYYVSTFLGFMKPLPPSTYISIFLILKISKFYPTSAYVVYEWSLRHNIYEKGRWGFLITFINGDSLQVITAFCWWHLRVQWGEHKPNTAKSGKIMRLWNFHSISCNFYDKVQIL